MIGVVGAGRMGGALIEGWLDKGTPAADIAIIDPSPGEAAKAALAKGAREGAQWLDDADVLLLSVKPQIFPKIIDEIADRVPQDALVISIMAGTTLQTLMDAFPGRRLVRAMPNTPAAIGKGVTGLYAPGGAADAVAARELLEVSGPVIALDSERDIDRVTAVSGSGPAYVFHLVEALSQGGQAIGLSQEHAARLARETIIGAARLLEAGGEPGDLREAVTSPGGTTQAGLDVLMAELPDLMARTVTAAFVRAVELGEG